VEESKTPRPTEEEEEEEGAETPDARERELSVHVARDDP